MRHHNFCMRHYPRRFDLCKLFTTKGSMSSKPSNNNAACMTEMDPTLMTESMPFTDQGHRDSHKTSGHHNTTVVYHTGQQQQSASKAPSIKRYLPAFMTADRTSNQSIVSPLPASLQFDTHTGGNHLLRSMVSPKICDMLLSVSTKQLKTLVTGCVK